MATSIISIGGRGILQYSRWDALLVSLALAHGILLLRAPSTVMIALGLWWVSNTISHNFIHLPFFRLRALNTLFSWYLSLLLGIPQSLWRERHLAHHAGIQWQARLTKSVTFELCLISVFWSTLLALAPSFFLTVYLPGYLMGLGLCYVQGHYEHARGTTSHYGIFYNLPFFNDGYHVEHHELPGEHWTRLPTRIKPGAQSSCWPPILRWVENLNLDSLERLVLCSISLQQFVLRKHERAFRFVLPELHKVRTVVIVGGGLFPRTALVLQRLLPGARLVIVDASQENIKIARSFINGHVEFIHGFYDASESDPVDLVVIPLSYMGGRDRIYLHPPAPAVVVHDWIWNRRGMGVVISLLLLKRLNLIKR